MASILLKYEKPAFKRRAVSAPRYFYNILACVLQRRCPPALSSISGQSTN